MRTGLAVFLVVVGLTAPFGVCAGESTESQASRSKEPRRSDEGRAGGLPPADQPMLRRIPQPVLSVEGGGGIVGFVGGTGAPGPGWNLRITGALSDRVAIEGNYLGSINERIDTNDSLVMTTIDAGIRYNLLLADEFVVQPFVVGGAGYAGFAGKNGDPAMLVVPLAVGVERLLTPNVKIGARFGYRPAFFDDLSTPKMFRNDKLGADTWTLLAQVGGGF